MSGRVTCGTEAFGVMGANGGMLLLVGVFSRALVAHRRSVLRVHGCGGLRVRRELTTYVGVAAARVHAGADCALGDSMRMHAA